MQMFSMQEPFDFKCQFLEKFIEHSKDYTYGIHRYLICEKLSTLTNICFIGNDIEMMTIITFGCN